MARGRTPLRILIVAFAASALCLVLQTVIYQLLPYDSSAIGKVSVALRVGFLLADVAALIGLVALGWRWAPSRAFASLGGLLALGGVVSGAVGLAASAIGSSAQLLGSLATPLSSAEPMWSLGVTLLASLGIASLAPESDVNAPPARLVRRIVTAIGALVALAIMFRIGRLAVPGQRSLVTAWTSWGLEVVRPALVAWLALVVVRGAGEAGASSTGPDGPYRAAGEGAPVTAAVPAGAAATEALRQAGRALGFYQVTFAVRLAAGFLTPLAAVFVSAIIRGDSSAPVAVLVVLGIGAGGLGTIAAIRLLALPRGAQTRGLVIGAAVASGLAILIDLAIGLYGLWGRLSGSRYIGDQNVVFGLSVGWPIAMLLGGVSLIFVAGALGRVGRLLTVEPLVARARLTQGLAIFTGALQTGSVLAIIGATSGRYTSSSTPGSVLLFLMVLGAIGVTVATPIVHLVLLSRARRHLQLSMQPSPSASAGL